MDLKSESKSGRREKDKEKAKWVKSNQSIRRSLDRMARWEPVLVSSEGHVKGVRHHAGVSGKLLTCFQQCPKWREMDDDVRQPAESAVRGSEQSLNQSEAGLGEGSSSRIGNRGQIPGQ